MANAPPASVSPRDTVRPAESRASTTAPVIGVRAVLSTTLPRSVCASAMAKGATNARGNKHLRGFVYSRMWAIVAFVRGRVHDGRGRFIITFGL